MASIWFSFGGKGLVRTWRGPGRVRRRAARARDSERLCRVGSGGAVAGPVVQQDLDCGRDRDCEQRAEDAEQRGAREHRDDGHERVDVERSAVYEWLQDVVLEALVEHDED